MGSKYEILFWLGLGLGYVMTFELTIIRAQVRIVILINEPA